MAEETQQARADENAADPAGDKTGAPAAASIGEADVRHVAKLARLAVPDADLPRLAGQLESILGYVAQIRQVDVAGVPPTAHALRVTNVLRDDAVAPALPTEAVLRNAPAAEPPFFKVPKVIGGDEDSAG